MSMDLWGEESSTDERLLSETHHIQNGYFKQKNGAGVVATFFNFAKASIGSGSFALPSAILSAGVLIGSSGMIILGVVSLYTMQLMLECKTTVTDHLAPLRHNEPVTYTRIGREALGFVGKWAVDLSVLGCNLGVCAGYMIFIASNMQYAVTCFANPTPNESVALDQHDCGITFITIYEWYFMILPVLILLTFLPSFKVLAYAAYVGAVFLAVAMITVFVWGGEHSHNFTALQCDLDDECFAWFPSAPINVAQWFGITAFLFCVHSMVIPLESGMKRPDFMPSVLDAACIVVLVVNLPFAVFGYLLFGNDTKGYIFEHMPGGNFNDTVRLFLSLELTLTFPIVFRPASDVMEEIVRNAIYFIHNNFPKLSCVRIYESRLMYDRIARLIMIYIVRTLMVLVSWGMAVAIPRFELCLAFVGSLATSVLAFILPPLFHLLLRWRRTSITRNALHAVILLLGTVATVLATGINLYEAIVNRSESSNCSDILTNCWEK